MLRRCEVGRFDAQRVRDARRHAAQHQPLVAPRAVVGAQQRLGLLDRCARPIARAVEDEAHRAGLALRHVGAERVVDDEHDVEVAAADLRLVIVGRVRHADLLPLEERDERRRVLRPGDRQRQLAGALGLARDQVEDQQQQNRTGEDRRHECHHACAAVPQRFEQLLAQDRERSRGRKQGQRRLSVASPMSAGPVLESRL